MGQVSAVLNTALAELFMALPELEAAAVVTFDGLPMASALPPSMDEERVAAMSAALLSLGEKAAAGLGRGELSQVFIQGESGTVFLMSAREQAVLVAVAPVGAKTGLMIYEVRRAAEQVGLALESSLALPRQRTRTPVGPLAAALPEPPHLEREPVSPPGDSPQGAATGELPTLPGDEPPSGRPLPRGWARYASASEAPASDAALWA